MTNKKDKDTGKKGGAAAEAIQSGEATPGAGATEGNITGGAPTEETLKGEGREPKGMPGQNPEPSRLQKQSGSDVRRGE